MHWGWSAHADVGRACAELLAHALAAADRLTRARRRRDRLHVLLPEGVAAKRGIQVVPLSVRLGARVGQEGVDIDTAQLCAALADRRLDVQTSRPAPAEFAARYHAALDARCLGGRVRAPLERAVGHLGGGAAGGGEVGADRVRVVDSRAACMGLGFAVLAAADAADAGGGWTRSRRRRSRPRRGAACSSRSTPSIASAAGDASGRRRVVGTALAVKPLLHVAQGRILPLEKVRTSARAAQRLVELAVQAAGGGPVDVAVQHLAAASRAEELAARLRERLDVRARLLVSEVGAVIGAHVGPGLLGVVVAPRRAPRLRRLDGTAS